VTGNFRWPSVRHRRWYRDRGKANVRCCESSLLLVLPLTMCWEWSACACRPNVCFHYSWLCAACSAPCAGICFIDIISRQTAHTSVVVHASVLPVPRCCMPHALCNAVFVWIVVLCPRCKALIFRYDFIAKFIFPTFYYNFADNTAVAFRQTSAIEEFCF